MYKDKKVVVVMPAYNAARTLAKTHAEILEEEFVDLVIVVDDASRDETTRIAQALPKTQVHTHAKNAGYGANQKTCYTAALDAGADIIVMIHADYQYTPRLLPAMVAIIANDVHKCVLGSRILGGYALAGGMPIWKYIANRFLTASENLLLGSKLSEYHTGYRAFGREVLEQTPWRTNSNDFIFDNEILAEIHWAGFSIGEVSCPTKYFAEASSINFTRSLKYGFGCLRVGMLFRLAKWGLRIGRGKAMFPAQAVRQEAVARTGGAEARP
jgi:glycosyltransferase involved in cell wall biosynthesis